MGKFAPASPARRRDRLVGLAIIVLAFGGCMGLSVWGMKISTPRPAPKPAPASKAGLAGYPDKVEPFSLLERARSVTVRDHFVGFEARGVAKDGTVDLKSQRNFVRYAFQSAKGRGPQPVREPGTLPERRFCGTQSVTVDAQGMAAAKDRAEVSCSSRKDIEDLGVPAHCSLTDLWNVALTHKFKDRGTAHVEYYHSNAGPAYRFKKDGRTLVISALDCKREFKGRSERGSVPQP